MASSFFMEIPHDLARDFLYPRHYAGRVPNIMYAFGAYDGFRLMAVCTFGKPATHTLCVGVCGESWANNVIELNRLCREEDYTAPLSSFVGWCLRRLRKQNVIVVSYSDTAMNHHGYIYQATNFLYTGMTEKRTDKYTPNGYHTRHYKKYEDIGGKYRKVRSCKHRYIYFCTTSKRLRKEWEKALRYPILPYPKGDNCNYELGHYLQDQIIDISGAHYGDV